MTLNEIETVLNTLGSPYQVSTANKIHFSPQPSYIGFSHYLTRAWPVNGQRLGHWIIWDAQHSLSKFLIDVSDPFELQAWLIDRFNLC